MNDMELADVLANCPFHTEAGSPAIYRKVPEVIAGRIIAALRRAALAQTEIKGHMRVVDDLKARIKKLEWDHYDAWAPMFNRLMMVCHRLAKGLPIRLEEVQGWGNEHPAPQAQARISELEKLLRSIVSLDDDAHPGLSTWHDMRVRAHEAAKEALKPRA